MNPGVPATKGFHILSLRKVGPNAYLKVNSGSTGASADISTYTDLGPVVTIGAGVSSGGSLVEFSHMRIAELYVFNRELSSVQFSEIETQLQNRYADATCSTDGEFLFGACWYQGNPHESCDDVCGVGARNGYNVATENAIGAHFPACRDIAATLLNGSGFTNGGVTSTQPGMGCHCAGGSCLTGGTVLLSQTTQSTQAASDVVRFCACND